MSRAIRFDRFGGPEVLRFEDIADRRPGAGEVSLKVDAVGLNRAESMYYHGSYMEKPELPSGLGYEAVGTVTAVGTGVDASLVGHRFGTIPGFSMNRYPVLAETAVVPAGVLAAVPDPFPQHKAQQSGCNIARRTAHSCLSARYPMATSSSSPQPVFRSVWRRSRS